jgi:hypothetical protein
MSDILSRARQLLARSRFPQPGKSSGVPSAGAISAGRGCGWCVIGLASTPGLDDDRYCILREGPCLYGCPVKEDQVGFLLEMQVGK